MAINKRRIPRHVDGRIKIGPFPLKNFFILLPFVVPIIITVFSIQTPFALFVGMVTVGVISFLFIETAHKETGFDIALEIIKSEFSGDQYYERSPIDVPNYQRITRNRKVEKIRARQKTNVTN